MNLFRLLGSRNWVLGRRLALVGIILILAFRTYGGGLWARFQGASGERDVRLTRYEFRPDVGGGKPVWIIGLKNYSSRYTYDRIELKSEYRNATGSVIQTDKLVVRQKLGPGEEQLIASPDIKERPGATAGSLEIMDAASIKP